MSEREEVNPVACEWSEDEWGVVWTSCGVGYEDIPAVSTCPSCSGRVVFIPSVELEAIAALRSQLADVKGELQQALDMNNGDNGTNASWTYASMYQKEYLRANTVERERDEARRERDALKAKFPWHRGDEGLPDVPVLQGRYDAIRHRAERMEQECDQFASMLHDCENERDGWKHRTERMEAAIRTVRDAYNEQRSDSEKDTAWRALMQTLDATPTVRDTST